MTLTSDQTLLLVLGVLAAIGILAAVTSGRRAAARAAKGVREMTRLTGTAGRAIVTAAIVTAIQWAVVTHISETAVVVPTLAVPALFAGTQVARLLSVREVIYTTRRGGGRR